MRILLAFLSFFVCGGVVSAMLTAGVYMVAGGEAPQLSTTLLMLVPFGLACVVLFIGVAGGSKAEAARVYLARGLLAAGAVGGIACGLWAGHGELEQRRDIDESTCYTALGDRATGTRVATCMPVARDCRRTLGDTSIDIPRGKTRPDGWPKRLKMPRDSGMARARVKCVYDRGLP